ncbi:DMSO reductase maturation protein DsmD [Canicola haemoglobinophilus]|uniref:Twin-argninine leader-binding protein for DmsA and TorA n=1 Tax=Canicola haemoglobinophilus TaxID=733 RepID=A0A1V4B243_9PAST|nr:Tat proofreading chaperone DmsD [Canicola haemoglobinophilus]OOS01295.1 DMSO reductase maturation protein DsmD [Canicola haemoglobinophilus]STO60143.1 twin-argninine leader-binding protein for DmsA and TorA [Canicola haemoglobinophilus]
MNQKHLNWVSTSGRLLGALFYFEPFSPELSNIFPFFQQSEWEQEWQVVLPKNLLQNIKEGMRSSNLDVEYQTLFIGPNSLIAPPWGSVYLDPEAVIFGDSLLKLREFLDKNRIEFISKQDEPEDHIGIMLMLSAYLAENNPTLLPEFLQQHFLIWSSRYLDLLIAGSESDFYKGIGLLTRITLEDWKSRFHLDVPKVHFYR